MATPVIMPRQGQSVESCIIGKWYKQVGDKVSVGDDLFSYETDKATFDEAAKVDGEVLAIFFPEDDDVPCLTTVCVIGAAGESTAEFDPRGAGTSEPATPSAPAAVSATQAAPIAASPSATAVDLATLAISPRAKALARKQNVDLRAAAPSGPKGRVIERDVLSLIDAGKFATGAVGSDFAAGTVGSGIGGRVAVSDLGQTPAQPSAAPVSAPAASVVAASSYEEKHTNIRKLIAKSMVQSLSTMAQLTYNLSFDASEILDFRAKHKKARDAGLTEAIGLPGNITLNDIILYVVSRVVKNHKMCNAHYLDETMRFFNSVNLGLAVDTPRGLMVPTIFNADQLTIGEISAQARAHASACQTGTISPDQLKDGTITVSNLGALGIESFTPVINPPQTCILGVNTLTTAVRDVGGVAVPYPSMNLSLTADHRAIDGAPAARFLKDLKNALENFSLLLMK